MKYLLFLSLIVFSFSCQAQFFKPLPKLSRTEKFALGIAADSTMNAFRPVIAISATVSNGASLASGAGVGYEHLKWDQASQSWVTVYSISAIGFITTNGSSIGGTAGLVLGIPGTNGLISAGPGYDFTGKQIVFITGVQIQFK